MRRYRRLVLTLLLLGALATALYQIPTGYYLVSPGAVTDLDPSIAVGGAGETLEGSFFMVTISARKANLIAHLYGLVSRSSELVPEELMRRPGESDEEYRRRGERMMEESQILAKAVALREAGYEAEITGSGVLVTQVMTGGPSDGYLQRGDRITAIDGKPVETTADLLSIIGRKRPGEKVRVEVLRDGQPEEYTLGVVSHPEDPTRGAILITIEAAELRLEAPVDITIDIGNVTGPSAGLGFALTIYSKLTGEDLSGGKKVAVTGTIDQKGNVGPIGGILQKLRTVEEAGIDLFLVPRDDLDELKDVRTEVEILPVSTFEEAVKALRQRAVASRISAVPVTTSASFWAVTCSA